MKKIAILVTLFICVTSLYAQNTVVKGFTYDDRYPALLRVVLVTDTIYNEDSTSRWIYCDTVEVKVEEENIIDKKVNKPAETKAYLSKYFIR